MGWAQESNENSVLSGYRNQNIQESLGRRVVKVRFIGCTYNIMSDCFFNFQLVHNVFCLLKSHSFGISIIERKLVCENSNWENLIPSISWVAISDTHFFQFGFEEELMERSESAYQCRRITLVKPALIHASTGALLYLPSHPLLCARNSSRIDM
jgi:hypothetical protein